MKKQAEQQKRGEPRPQLVEARHKRRLSQQELADELGTTHVNVSRWERGITKPTPYFRRKLCTLFGKTEVELDLLPFPAAAGNDDNQREEPPPVVQFLLTIDGANRGPDIISPIDSAKGEQAARECCLFPLSLGSWRFPASLYIAEKG